MIELSGKYTDAIIFTDEVEDAAMEQLKTLLDQPFVEGSRIRVMPDVHKGAGCTIGTTMTIQDKICPNLVGVDIGCGMFVVELGRMDPDLDRLDSVIRENIPAGFNVYPEALPDGYNMRKDLIYLRCMEAVDIDRAVRSVGTLGGGNHFIELDTDEEGNKYLVIHSGSRNLGKCVAEYYQNEANRIWKDGHEDRVQKMIQDLKDCGHPELISDALRIYNTVDTIPPKDLAYCYGELTADYLHDERICTKFANMNRIVMARRICEAMHWWDSYYHFETVHNYIDETSFGGTILRKGAVSASKGEELIIPMNMRDGSLICVGKGNPNWNFSAPHGAGRVMSRSQAKREVSVKEFEDSMQGIYSTSVNKDTLDECPMAYKPVEAITKYIDDTVYVDKVIKPIYNFKAS